VADLEKRFALAQGHPALILVITEGQLAAQVEFDLAAIGQGHRSGAGVSAVAFMGIGHPAQLPAAVGRHGESEQGNGGGHGKTLPGAATRGRR